MKRQESETWGGSGQLRRLWGGASTTGLSSYPSLLETELAGGRSGYAAVSEGDVEPEAITVGVGVDQKTNCVYEPEKTQEYSLSLQELPAVFLAVLVNLFLSLSFGSAFYPSQWEFPPSVSRSIGVQQFLLSTALCQFSMTFFSSFPFAIGMMMVENIPFQITIALLTIEKQGMGVESFATVFFTNALMSLLVGAAFYACGHCRAGSMLNVIPKSLILGCIGGIGVFIFKTGVEVSIGETLSLDVVGAKWQLWAISALFEVLLRLLQRAALSVPWAGAIVPPIYFCSIPVLFYLGLLGLGVPTAVARTGGWFFPTDTGSISLTAPLLLLDITKVDWGVVLSAVPTMLASVVFALLHVPLNVPALKLTSKHAADINQELVAHGVSNLLSGLLGQQQNYLCYSNSVLYYRCRGKGKVASLLVASLTLLFYGIGPGIVSHVPRCMPGCLLIHIGIDLTREALVDSLAGGAFDTLEYLIVVSLTVVITAWGMTVGLIIGILAACVVYILQSQYYIPPVRRQTRCTTLRSAAWRSARASRLLPPLLRRVLWLQLQGSLFFGNSQILAVEMENAIARFNGPPSAIGGAAVEKEKEKEKENLSSELGVNGTGTGTGTGNGLDGAAGYGGNGNGNRSNPSHSPHPHSRSRTVSSSGSSTISVSDSENRPDHLDGSDRISMVILDFTLVLSIDASAVDVITGLVRLGEQYKCGIVFVRGSPAGFPCASGLSESLRVLSVATAATAAATAATPPRGSQSQSQAHPSRQQHPQQTGSPRSTFIVDDLEAAVRLCEDVLLASFTDIATQDKEAKFRAFLRDSPPHLFQLLHCVPNPRQIDKLVRHFTERRVGRGELLWRQGDRSVSAVLLKDGRLRSFTSDEELGLSAEEHIHPGHLVGEFGLIKADTRRCSLKAEEDSTVLELSEEAWRGMTDEVKLLLATVCILYLDRRTAHVSNFLLHSRSLPV